MTCALRLFRRSPLLLLAAALMAVAVFQAGDNAPPAEAQTLAKPEVAQVVRLHLGAYLFWHESSGADSYVIHIRSRTSGSWGSWAVPANPISITQNVANKRATLTGLTAGTKYQWRIRATSGSQMSEWSEHDDVNDLAYNWTAESLGGNIANPAVLQSAAPVPGSPGQVKVTWTHGPARSGVMITGWTVGYRLFSEPVNQIRQTSLLAATATMATVTGLTGGEQYEFWVRPYVQGHPGRTSNALEATPTTASETVTAVTVAFGQSSYSVDEGSDVMVTVGLSANPERTVTIPISKTNQGGATSADYSGVPANVTFNSGETSKSFTFAATADTVDDDNESVKLTFGTLPAGVSGQHERDHHLYRRR